MCAGALDTLAGGATAAAHLLAYCMLQTMFMKVLGEMSRSSLNLYMLVRKRKFSALRRGQKRGARGGQDTHAASTTHIVWTSEPRPVRPTMSLSCMEKILLKSVATVCSCTPSLVSLQVVRMGRGVRKVAFHHVSTLATPTHVAMPTQSFPVMATMAPPLYSMMPPAMADGSVVGGACGA